MKLTITVEDDKEAQVHVLQPGAAGAGAAAGEDTSEPAAASGGGPPDWLLAELGEAPHIQGMTSSEALDAGPAPLGTNGMASAYP